MPRSLTLISHDLCPYVQRAAISLTEKQVPFERLYIDLANKPDWFKAISPLGKVPVLQVDGYVLFESAAILEFLEETQQNPLHPQDPVSRARHRAWIEFGSVILGEIAGLYSAKNAADFQQKTRSLSEKFTRVEGELGKGPYFAGESFSLVDTVYGPIFRYFDVFDTIGNFGILNDKPRLTHWRCALSTRSSVVHAVVPDYAQRLESFLIDRKSHLSRLMLQSIVSVA